MGQLHKPGKGEIHMAKGKANRERPKAAPGVAPPEALEAYLKGGNPIAWVREDGAICFGDECVVIHPAPDGSLDMEIKPDRCGQAIGQKLVDHLIQTAGQGVNFKIRPVEK